MGFTRSYAEELSMKNLFDLKNKSFRKWRLSSGLIKIDSQPNKFIYKGFILVILKRFKCQYETVKLLERFRNNLQRHELIIS